MTIMAAMAQVVHCSCPDSRLPASRNQHSPSAFAAPRASTVCRAELKSSSPPAAEQPPVLASRRILWVSVGIALGLQLQKRASAKDIPLFGIKKRQAEKPAAVVPAPAPAPSVEKLATKAQEIVVEAKKQFPSITSSPADSSSSSSSNSISPSFQAGAVVAAELLAVLVATSVVSRFVTGNSK